MDALALLKALAHETRFEMLRMLHVRDLCVCEFEAALAMQQSKVSYHLAVLKEAGLVSSRQEGRWTVNRLERRPLYQLGGLVQEALSQPLDLGHIADCRAQEATRQARGPEKEAAACAC